MDTVAQTESSVKAEALSIAIQGEKGSYHELAARRFFGQNLRLACCDSFPELFRNLDQQQSEFAIVAIENSVAGTILPNYALLRKSDFRIIGEVYLRISHMLMALPDTKLEDIREVHSHPMALQQCLGYLDTIPRAKLVERDDTAASARRIAEHRMQGVAAIASSLAARYYGLKILQAAIEDDLGNYTRFFVLGRSAFKLDTTETVNKASLCFSLGHEVGSLSQILVVLGAHGMNLTKIQSSPIVGKVWEYFFHLDLEFEEFAQYQRAIESIRSLVSELKVLGEYPKAHKTPKDSHSSL